MTRGDAEMDEQQPRAGWEQVDLLSLVSGSAAAPVVPEPAPEPAAETAVVADRAEAPEPSPAARLSGPSGPELLLILDTETTGLSPAEHRCIEVGAVLFSVPDRSVLSQVSFLMPCTSNAAEAVNGIAPALTQRPQPWQAGLACFEAMVEAADVLLAHNAAFDQQWFGLGSLPALSKPWLCSMEDIRWPQERQLRSTPSVRDLALAYGVPVWAAHRALTDCIYLAQVFERCEDLEDLLLQAMEPRRLYRARLSYEERHKAREAGFRWNQPVSGAWSRRLSEREVALLPFPVVPVDEAAELRSA
ncbi:3'-5' exonuclease [Synechococcus sp. NB0720_010]|uniref:3'-5' exonuclease n=1 Tax=Synechococcus sp. NB0720_010 TaxID=2907159 RepID=UPI001FFC23C0|nr:3'-5' exonuclease [Synechococcus sp. NB0720_010]UPH90311.1 3'-5' exonuclease [Synechococcus sp. NB0720_010]